MSYVLVTVGILLVVGLIDIAVLAWTYRTRSLQAIREAKRAQAIATALREVCQVAGIQVAITETETGLDITAVHRLMAPEDAQETRH